MSFPWLNFGLLLPPLGTFMSCNKTVAASVGDRSSSSYFQGSGVFILELFYCLLPSVSQSWEAQVIPRQETLEDTLRKACLWIYNEMGTALLHEPASRGTQGTQLTYIMHITTPCSLPHLNTPSNLSPTRGTC